MGTSAVSDDGSEPISPPSPGASATEAVTPAGDLLDKALAERKALERSFHDLDLFSHSKRFRDKIEREHGSCTDWIVQQIDCAALTFGEYRLLLCQLLMCHPSMVMQEQALTSLAVLSMVTSRLATERQYWMNMRSKEPPPPPKEIVDLPSTSVRALPSDSDWQALFSD